jgi:hypothetical protein
MRQSKVRMIPELLDRRSRPNVDYIYDAPPFATKLADLLRVRIHQQGYLVGVLDRFGLHVRQIDSTPRNCAENPHQGSLCVAITNMKDMHKSSITHWSNRAATFYSLQG